MNFTITEKSLGLKEFCSQDGFKFEHGGEIAELILCYETFGNLNASKDNVILIHHAISTDTHVCSHSANPAKGWWQAMVGPGKPIDTERYFVICINNLASCFGSSGPNSIKPETQQPYRTDFPRVTVNDIVYSQHLLVKALGIKQLYAIIGNSMGAMMSLAWSILFPDTVVRLISVSSCYKAYPVSIAYHTIQKEIMQLDPAWQSGDYQQNPVAGLQLARKIGLVSYRDAVDLNRRFATEGDIREYLDYNAAKLAQRFDANCYLYLLDVMDTFDVTATYTDPVAAFAKIQAQVQIISVDSDVLYPPSQQQDMYALLNAAGVQAEFISIQSDYGHDAFYADANIAGHVERFINDQR